jgi:protein-tyrosine phosphatase
MIDIELYGGRRGYVEHLRARALDALGSYASARKIKWPAIKRLVFVCQGNICRSPYAAARAQSLGMTAISFGLEATEGACADQAALRNALPRGIDLSAHRSARLQGSLLAAGDLIVAFEPKQIPQVIAHTVPGLAGTTLLGIWARPVRPLIHDPFGQSNKYFQHCFSLIDANVRELAGRAGRHGAIAEGAAAIRQSGSTSL